MKRKVQTWREIAEDAREIERRLAAHVFAGRRAGSEFRIAMNVARGVLRRATSLPHPYLRSFETSQLIYGYHLLNRVEEGLAI